MHGGVRPWRTGSQDTHTNTYGIPPTGPFAEDQVSLAVE